MWIVNLQVKNLGAKWRRIIRGINLFDKCENEKCEAYNFEVIQTIKEQNLMLLKIMDQWNVQCVVVNQN